MANNQSLRDRTVLTQTFNYKSTLFSYAIKWVAIGDSSLPPLVFIHGTPWSSKVWAPFAVSLSQHFRVYLSDNAGFGESPLGSPLPDKASSITKAIALDGNLAEQTEVFAALFKSWEKEWNGQRAHVVAHDHAGLMSLRAHLLHGLDYASLCLIDVVAIGPFGTPLFKLAAEEQQTFEKLPRSVFEGILESYIRDASHRPLSPQTLEMLKEPWLTEGGQSRFIRQMCQANSRSTDDLEKSYSEIGNRFPIKIIWGADDKWLPVEIAGKLASALHAGETTIIEDAGHLIMYDQGEQLGVALGWWLSKASGTTKK